MSSSIEDWPDCDTPECYSKVQPGKKCKGCGKPHRYNEIVDVWESDSEDDLDEATPTLTGLKDAPSVSGIQTFRLFDVDRWVTDIYDNMYGDPED